MKARIYPNEFNSRVEAKEYIKSICFKDSIFSPISMRFVPDSLVIFIKELCSFPLTLTKAEAAYWLLNDLTDYPCKCQLCNTNITKFNSFNTGYIHKFCSSKCSNKGSIQTKIDSNREKYGVDFPQQLKVVKEKIKQSSLNTWWSSDRFNFEGFTLLTKKEDWRGSDLDKFSWSCDKCTTEFQQTAASGKLIPICPACDNTAKTSKEQREIVDWLKSVYDGPIIINDRSKIYPLELDILLPEKKLAIEFNGLYWHSYNEIESESEIYYHLNKSIQANKKDLTLIHVFEHTWYENKDAVKHRILHALKIQKPTFARKTSIQEIDTLTASAFLKTYHTAGTTNASVKLGMFYDNELIGVMTFIRSRFSKKLAPWEIARCAFSKPIIGGISKLVAHFQKLYETDLMTYADKNWSNGYGYLAAGFEQSHHSKPGYFYYKDKILSRYACQKHKLAAQLENFDASLSEAQNMFNHGYRRVWDCGNVVLVKKFYK